MLNIQRILFTTDLSDGSERAFPQAAYLADWHDAEMHILNVAGRHEHNYSEMKDQFPLSLDTLSDWLRRPAASDADTNMPDLEAMSIEQQQIESATPPDEILSYVDDHDIDLVVMSTHGHRGVDRMLFGSVTAEVVRTASCPVLTVRQDAETTPDQAIRRVLVPVDFSDASKAAVHHAKEIALTYGAEIDLLHAVQEPLYPATYGIDATPFPTEEVVERVEAQLADMVREEIGYEHAMIKAVVGHPSGSIVDYVEDNAIDLVVIATHGRTGTRRMVLGSVTERVLRQVSTPVFVVKPDDKSLLPTSSKTEV